MIDSVNTALFNEQVKLEKDKNPLSKEKHKQKMSKYLEKSLCFAFRIITGAHPTYFKVGGGSSKKIFDPAVRSGSRKFQWGGG